MIRNPTEPELTSSTLTYVNLGTSISQGTGHPKSQETWNQWRSCRICLILSEPFRLESQKASTERLALYSNLIVRVILSQVACNSPFQLHHKTGVVVSVRVIFYLRIPTPELKI
jgi:hypothetical protein